MNDLAYQAESEPKLLSALFASDSHLDEPARTELSEIFQFLGLATVEELMDMSSLGPVSQYLVSGLVRYQNAKRCNVTGVVRAAMGRIASLATPPAGLASEQASQTGSMGQGQHAHVTIPYSMSMQNPDAKLLLAPYSDFTREVWNNRHTLRSLMKPRKNVIMKKPAGKPPYSMSMQNPDAELLFAPYSDFTREMWSNRHTLRSLMKPRKNVIMKKPAGKPAGKIAKKPASNGGAKKNGSPEKHNGQKTSIED